MSRIIRFDSYGHDVMVQIIYDVLHSEWPDEFKKHILLKELLWSHDSPKGVRGDTSDLIFSSKAKKVWEDNEATGVKPKKGIVFEHAVPRLVIYKELTKRKKVSKKFISGVIRNMLFCVAVTDEEDAKLNKSKLRQAMPDDWDGVDPFARHSKVKIKHLKRWKPEKYK